MSLSEERTQPLQQKMRLGMEVFESLRAEDEPWLPHCFVPPPEFERVRGRGSVIVFGGTGSGKTAIAQILEYQNRETPQHLIVPWRPAPVPPNVEGGADWVYRLTRHLLDACAGALATHLVRHPDVVGEAPEWVRARIVWFLHRFTAAPPHVRLGQLLEEALPGVELLREIVSASPEEILYEDATPDQIIVELVSTVQALGLEGLWVITDGLERWLQADARGIMQSMRAFLDTLVLFEHPGLAFKIFVPAQMEPTISRAGGVLRRRLEAYRLRWHSEDLERIVNARLALALGKKSSSLKSLCQAPELLTWLQRVGAQSPREWLDQIAPLVAYYLNRGNNKPVSKQEWERMCREHPPRIYLDEARHRVIVGGREIPLECIPVKAYEMLKYLYERAGDVVSRQELYYRVYRGLDYVPRSPTDENYEAPKEYEGVVDTTIWRLRKAIEPDPKKPVLLVTVRGHGVRLVVRW